LKALVRWALDHFHEDEDFVNILEMVVLEFKPIAEIANGSDSARKMLKLLDGWIAQKKVTRHLWGYMDELLQRWRYLNRNDFTRSMIVFQTLRTMYQFSQRQLDAQEIEFISRMEKLLSHESVKLVMYHATMLPTEGETRIMECMVYADARKSTGSTRRSRERATGSMSPNSKQSSGKSTPPSKREDSDEEDENDPLETYTCQKTSGTGWQAASMENTPPQQRGKATDSPKTVISNEDISVVPPTVERKPVLVKTLKKPFFRDFKDFMDFDLVFKHKMPITLSEFDFLSGLRDEPLTNWDVCVDRKEIKIAKTQTETGCITLRAWATVPGVDMGVAFYLFANHIERVKWDKVFAKMSLVAEDVQGSQILYSLMKVPAVTPRDFLQYRRCLVREDGSVQIVLRSAAHQDMPEQKGVIRAESYIAGYILKATYNGTTPVLNIFLMSCLDIKGLIPKWVINLTAPRKPAEWVETLRKAALEYQESHPNYHENMKEELEKYKLENPYDFEMVPEEFPDDKTSIQTPAMPAGEPIEPPRLPSPRTPPEACPREAKKAYDQLATPKDTVVL
jgi:hypothetical protein